MSPDTREFELVVEKEMGRSESRDCFRPSKMRGEVFLLPIQRPPYKNTTIDKPACSNPKYSSGSANASLLRARDLLISQELAGRRRRRIAARGRTKHHMILQSSDEKTC